MFIRQVPDLNCEYIKNALQDINNRLNYLQSQMPHEKTLIKDPIIPKLNLSKLGIKENNQDAIKIKQEVLKNEKSQNEIAKRNRSASLTFSNQQIQPPHQINFSFAAQIHSQQVSRMKPTELCLPNPQHTVSIKFVQQPSRNSTPLKTNIEIAQQQKGKQIQNQIKDVYYQHTNSRYNF